MIELNLSEGLTLDDFKDALDDLKREAVANPNRDVFLSLGLLEKRTAPLYIDYVYHLFNQGSKYLKACKTVAPGEIEFEYYLNKKSSEYFRDEMDEPARWVVEWFIILRAKEKNVSNAPFLEPPREVE